MTRCAWAAGDPLLRRYHDEEWGVPSFDDGHLFEMLLLEGAQAGLSWRSVLQRRDGYQRAFAGFDVALVAAFDETRRQELLGNPEIIRNRAKIAAAVTNAQAFLDLQASEGGFAPWLWGFVGGRTLDHRLPRAEDTPVSDSTSAELSRQLRARGFRFVGPTICYSLMQAVGLVNDHLLACFRHDEAAGDGALPPPARRAERISD